MVACFSAPPLGRANWRVRSSSTRRVYVSMKPCSPSRCSRSELLHKKSFSHKSLLLRGISIGIWLGSAQYPSEEPVRALKDVAVVINNYCYITIIALPYVVTFSYFSDISLSEEILIVIAHTVDSGKLTAFLCKEECQIRWRSPLCHCLSFRKLCQQSNCTLTWSHKPVPARAVIILTFLCHRLKGLNIANFPGKTPIIGEEMTKGNFNIMMR